MNHWKIYRNNLCGAIFYKISFFSLKNSYFIDNGLCNMEVYEIVND